MVSSSRFLHWLIATALAHGVVAGAGTLSALGEQHAKPQAVFAADAAVKSVESSNGHGSVTWDGYTLFLNGQRIFVWSGEFHPWRLPVPALWKDVLQKIKATGMNTISVYTHWGLSHPAPGYLDFDGYRSVERLLQVAAEVGLWVILRPGPYINAETTAGGIPHWVTSAVPAHLRTNDTTYYETWKPYIQKISEIAVPYQFTNGGPIIAVQMENEYVDRDDVGYPGKAEMMQQLKDEFIKGGINVPLTINDAYMGANYVNGTGAGDIYGFDSYPQNFDCSHPDVWNPLVTNYWDFHTKTNPDQPLFIPEFQGGAFDAWGPTAPGYSACKKLTGRSFESVFNLHLWAQNAKMVNIYMVYGGTSWGHLYEPGVYSSYDYGASISENRDIDSDKYAELKRQGLFLRSVPHFYKTDVIGNSTHSNEGSDRPVVEIDSKAVFGTLLKNPDSEARFYIVRHLDSTSNNTVSFHINVTVPAAAVRPAFDTITVPLHGNPIQLVGRESKVILANLKVGDQAEEAELPSVLYSTASLFFSGVISGRRVLFFYGDRDQHHELAIRMKQACNAVQPSHGLVVQTSPLLVDDYTIVNVLPGLKGLVTLWDNKDALVLYADTETTDTFWAPILVDEDGKKGSWDPFWSIGTNSTLLVGGPHLVRSASYSSKHKRLSLVGDLRLDKDTYLTVLGAPSDTRSVRWNGEEVQPMLASGSALQRSILIFHLRRHAEDTRSRFDPPKLRNWVYSDTLPEITSSFNDEDWTTADHDTTNLPDKPLYGENVLYGCDYGFCEGIVLWRGHFNATGNETAVKLAINGGEAFAASIYLNDIFLRTTYGNSTNNRKKISETEEIHHFPSAALRVNSDNVVTVIQDNMGLDETLNHWDSDASKSPRGIRGYELIGGSFTHWKVQGKLGGYERYADKLRGIFNEGGLFGERHGWHLPPTERRHAPSWARRYERWEKRGPSEGLPAIAKFARSGNSSDPEVANDGHVGVGFFRTSFDLHYPEGYDIMLSFEFVDVEESTQKSGGYRPGQPYRAMIFVNGWMMGKRIANLGPQTKFPVHQGILNYQGVNTLVILLWAMDAVEPVKVDMRLVVDKVYEGPAYDHRSQNT